MKKLLILSVILASCSQEPKETTVVQISAPEIIKVDLEKIAKDLDPLSDNLFEMNKKYVGHLVQIKGRTSGVTESGELLLQVKQGEEAIHCYGIPDVEFLTSIHENDIVEVMGVLYREEHSFVGYVTILKDCTYYKKL